MTGTVSDHITAKREAVAELVRERIKAAQVEKNFKAIYAMMEITADDIARAIPPHFFPDDLSGSCADYIGDHIIEQALQRVKERKARSPAPRRKPRKRSTKRPKV